MLKINFSRTAKKFLKTLPPKHARQLGLKIMELRNNPYPHDSIIMKGKAAEYRRSDAGEYRIVYQVQKEVLKIFVVGKRNDDQVYRQLKRKL